MLFRPQGTQNPWALSTYNATLSPMHQIIIFPSYSQTFSTAIFWMTSFVPSRWHPHGMVWMPGKFMGMAWTLGSPVALPPHQPLACPLHPPCLLPFPRGSWTRHCHGHDLSEWLKGCNMRAKPHTTRMTSWFIPKDRDFLFFPLDLIKDGTCKQCKRPLMPDHLHFSNAWRYPHSITSVIFKALTRGHQITQGGRGCGG